MLTRADDGDVRVVDPHRRLVDALLLGQRPLRVHLGQKIKEEAGKKEYGGEGKKRGRLLF